MLPSTVDRVPEHTAEHVNEGVVSWIGKTLPSSPWPAASSFYGCSSCPAWAWGDGPVAGVRWTPLGPSREANST